MPIEKELKYTLTSTEHARLSRALRERRSASVKQENFYFDDDRLSLRKLGLGLRVRLSSDRPPVLTLKHSAKGKTAGRPKSFKVRHEWETRLSATTARALIRGTRAVGSLDNAVASRLRRLAGTKLLANVRCIGRMATVRQIIPWEGECLELDRFTYFRITRYELEIETSRPARSDRVAKALFRRHGIPVRHNTQSKLRRFLKAWKARRK